MWKLLDFADDDGLVVLDVDDVDVVFGEFLFAEGPLADDYVNFVDVHLNSNKFYCLIECGS